MRNLPIVLALMTLLPPHAKAAPDTDPFEQNRRLGRGINIPGVFDRNEETVPDPERVVSSSRIHTMAPMGVRANAVSVVTSRPEFPFWMVCRVVVERLCRTTQTECRPRHPAWVNLRQRFTFPRANRVRTSPAAYPANHDGRVRTQFAAGWPPGFHAGLKSLLASQRSGSIID
jgi:hypothetical protein